MFINDDTANSTFQDNSTQGDDAQSNATQSGAAQSSAAQNNTSQNDNTGNTSTAQTSTGHPPSDDHAGNDIELLQKELEASKLKLAELTNISQRALADLQNFKRRAEEEKLSFITFANSALILELLPALDNVHRALEHAPTDPQVQEWLLGVTSILKQFENIFTEKGLKTIEALNQSFNPEYHEALLTENGPKDIVVREYEKGYLLNDKVIRRSKVAVGNGEVAKAETSTETK